MTLSAVWPRLHPLRRFHPISFGSPRRTPVTSEGTTRRRGARLSLHTTRLRVWLTRFCVEHRRAGPPWTIMRRRRLSASSMVFLVARYEAGVRLEAAVPTVGRARLPRGADWPLLVGKVVMRSQTGASIESNTESAIIKLILWRRRLYLELTLLRLSCLLHRTVSVIPVTNPLGTTIYTLPRLSTLLQSTQARTTILPPLHGRVTPSSAGQRLPPVPLLGPQRPARVIP